MASDYGMNFGFRRSDESLRLSDGRYNTPAGSALLIGTAVEVDFAEDGYLKASAADAPLSVGVSGLLLQELDWDQSIYQNDPSLLDSYQKGTARADRRSVITSGAGVKVWFKNTAGETRADGRVIDAVDIVDLTGLAAGDELGWDGTSWAKVDGVGVNNAWFVVTEVSASGCEAVLKA